MPYRVAVAVSGRGSNLSALCAQLQDSTEAEVVLVLADRNAPALATAEKRGLRACQLQDFRSASEWLSLLSSAEVDLLVLAGYLRLVPAEVVAAWRGRIINIHPALLPRHGGAGMYGQRVHQAVLRQGDTESGATVHLVDELYDRGQILGVARVPVIAGEDPEALAERVLAMEHRLLPAAVLAAARAGHPVPLTGAFAPPSQSLS